MTTNAPVAPAAPAAPSKPAPASPAAPFRQPSFADKLVPKAGAPAAPEKAETQGAPVVPASTRSTEGSKGPNENPGGTDKGAPAAPATVRFVVDGKPVEVEVTAEEAAFMEKNPRWKDRFQKSLGAEKRLQEGVRLRREAEAIIEMLKDPEAIFDHVLKHPSLGHKDVRSMVEGWLLKQIEVERMDPKDRELMTTKQELEAIREREAQEKKNVEQKRHDEMTQKFTVDYQKDIIAAVSSSGLPTNEETVGRVAFYLEAALTQYGKDLKAADVMPLVKQDYERMVRKLFSSSNGQLIADLLGEEGLKKIREYEIGRLRNPNGNGSGTPPRSPNGSSAPSHPSGTKPMSTDEWRDYLAKRRAEGE